MRNKQFQRIKNWRRIQTLYMPIVSTLLTEGGADGEGDTSHVKPEFEVLWLPSELEAVHRTTSAMKELAEKELMLRESEARDALHQVCSSTVPCDIY